MVKVIAAASFKNAVLKTIHTLTTSGSANNRRVPKLLLLTTTTSFYYLKSSLEHIYLAK